MGLQTKERRAYSSIPPKRSDPASFPKEKLRAIYGEQPNCFILPNRKAADWHHILGRGGTRDDKKMFSSVFNAAPLSREPHDHCPLLNSDGFRQALLAHAMKHVNYAIGIGLYRPTENDELFLAYVRSLAHE